jgi:hypothetical protein
MTEDELRKVVAITTKHATSSIPLELKFRKADVPLEHADRARTDRIPFHVPTTCTFLNDTLKLCKVQDPHFDQTHGLAFYHGEPRFLKCAIPPPVDFVFPPKAQLPPVHFPNLYTPSFDALLSYNGAQSKNHYHLNSEVYDAIQRDIIAFGEKYIPLQSKVRLVLDLGSAGGSFGLMMNAMYNTQSLSVAYPDWPYCEYITERGGLCMNLDAKRPLPFAKHSFDLIHAAWLYHSFSPEPLQSLMLDVNRMPYAAPGRLLVHRRRHVAGAVRSTFSAFGYQPLFLAEKPLRSDVFISRNNKLEIHFFLIYLKPSEKWLQKNGVKMNFQLVVPTYEHVRPQQLGACRAGIPPVFRVVQPDMFARKFSVCAHVPVPLCRRVALFCCVCLFAYKCVWN